MFLCHRSAAVSATWARNCSKQTSCYVAQQGCWAHLASRHKGNTNESSCTAACRPQVQRHNESQIQDARIFGGSPSPSCCPGQGLPVGTDHVAGKSNLLGRESHLDLGGATCLMKNRKGFTAEVSYCCTNELSAVPGSMKDFLQIHREKTQISLMFPLTCCFVFLFLSPTLLSAFPI